MTDFLKENYCVIHEPVCNSKLEVSLLIATAFE
jgi:hypothetical protein